MRSKFQERPCMSERSCMLTQNNVFTSKVKRRSPMISVVTFHGPSRWWWQELMLFSTLELWLLQGCISCHDIHLLGVSGLKNNSVLRQGMWQELNKLLGIKVTADHIFLSPNLHLNLLKLWNYIMALEFCTEY